MSALRVASSSVELRIRYGGILESDWGIITNSQADPKRGLKHLVITGTDYVARLLLGGPEPSPCGGTTSATIDGDRTFQHLDYEGKRWTWELFDAHFADGEGPDGLLIGRWPD